MGTTAEIGMSAAQTAIIRKPPPMANAPLTAAAMKLDRTTSQKMGSAGLRYSPIRANRPF
jgi:hypothetical protein